MLMTSEERELRKNLRLKLEKKIADRDKLFDNHGNEIKAIHLTDVMRLILEEDTEILELQNEIQKLSRNRMRLIEDFAIVPDTTVTDAIAKCRGLGISNFAYSQSIEDLTNKNDENSSLEELEKSLANDPKSCSKINKELLDFVKQNMQ